MAVRDGGAIVRSSGPMEFTSVALTSRSARLMNTVRAAIAATLGMGGAAIESDLILWF